MNTSITSSAQHPHKHPGHGFDVLMRQIQQNYEDAREFPLFVVDLGYADLFQVFLDNLPGDKQHYNCSACRRFVNKYGNLVTIDRSGVADALLWFGHMPSYFSQSVYAMRKVIENAQVTGVFYSDKDVWGTPSNADHKRGCIWQHMHIVPGVDKYRGTKNAGQRMAEKREEFIMLTRALGRFPASVAQTALQIVKLSQVLDRTEKVLGVAEWFCGLHDTLQAMPNRRRNLIWRAVAMAPAGWAHVSNTMLGTLLEDVKSGQFSLEQMTRRFNEKMDPLAYRRPQAPPKRGNVLQAQKLVEELGVERSLERRFARIEEIPTIWKPSVPQKQPQEGRIFDNLLYQDALKLEGSELPAMWMNWRDFKETLDQVARITYIPGVYRMPFSALVTAVHEDAPNILQWDNAVSWYVYADQSLPSTWNLSTGAEYEVKAIALSPTMWGSKKNTNFVDSVFFLIEGCKDTNYRSIGTSLFPEILKAKYHQIRSTIEAHSRKSTLQGFDEASACGLRLSKSKKWEFVITVHYKNGTHRQVSLIGW